MLWTCSHTTVCHRVMLTFAGPGRHMALGMEKPCTVLLLVDVEKY